MADPFENFIDPLRVVFSDPKTSAASETGDATGFYASLAVALTDFSAEALREAATRLKFAKRDLKEGRSFPLPEVCLSACKTAESDIDARRRAAVKPARRLSPNEEAGRDRYCEAELRSQMAKTSALEGWIIGFRDFCREHGRHPTPAEIGVLKLDTKALLSRLNEASKETNLGGVYARRILKAIKQREKVLKEKVFCGREYAA